MWAMAGEGGNRVNMRFQFLKASCKSLCYSTSLHLYSTSSLVLHGGTFQALLSL